MEKTIIKIGDTETEKQNFTSIKTYFIKNIDINKIVVSNIVSSGKKGFKYFIGYKNAKNIKHL